MGINYRDMTAKALLYGALFVSGSALSTTSVGQFTIPILVLCMALCLTIRPNRLYRISKLLLGAVWLVIGLFSTAANYNRSNLNAYLQFAFVVVLSMLITQRFSADEMIELFLKSIRMFAVIAVAMWVVTDIFRADLPLPEIRNHNNVWYQTAIIWNRYRYGAVYSSRICGPFWEPGLFSTYLCAAMLLEIRISRFYAKTDMILFSVAILLTQSAAGYAVFCLVLFIRVLHYNGKWRNVLAPLLIAASIVCLLLSNHIYERMIQSAIPVLQKFDFSDGSGASRLDSIYANLALLRKRPLFGYGLAEANLAYSNQVMLFKDHSQTSTSGLYMAAFGVPGIVYTVGFITPFLHAIRKKALSVWEGSLVVLIIMVIINKEPHTFFLTTYIAWFYLQEYPSEKAESWSES